MGGEGSGGEGRWGETYRLVHSKLGHLVERHLLHNHFPDLQLELLAEHQFHRLIQFPAVVNDADIIGPSRLEMELYLLIKCASLGLWAALWNNPHPTFQLGGEWLLQVAVIARPGTVLGLVSRWKCVGSCSTTVASWVASSYVCVCVCHLPWCLESTRCTCCQDWESPCELASRCYLLPFVPFQFTLVSALLFTLFIFFYLFAFVYSALTLFECESYRCVLIVVLLLLCLFNKGLTNKIHLKQFD